MPHNRSTAFSLSIWRNIQETKFYLVNAQRQLNNCIVFSLTFQIPLMGLPINFCAASSQTLILFLIFICILSFRVPRSWTHCRARRRRYVNTWCRSQVCKVNKDTYAYRPLSALGPHNHLICIFKLLDETHNETDPSRFLSADARDKIPANPERQEDIY